MAPLLLKTKVFGIEKTFKVIYADNKSTPEFHIESDVYMVESSNLDLTYIKAAITSYLNRMLKTYIQVRIKHFQQMMRLSPSKVRFEKSFKFWGQCNSDKIITFNFGLIQLPKEAIDYVIVHELAHLKHLNHDRSFWRLVGSIIPNYKEYES